MALIALSYRKSIIEMKLKQQFSKWLCGHLSFALQNIMTNRLHSVVFNTLLCSTVFNLLKSALNCYILLFSLVSYIYILTTEVS